MPDFATADGMGVYARRFADRTNHALTGMQQARHVEENLTTAKVAR